MSKEIYTAKGECILVDSENYEWLNQFTWWTNERGYVRNNNGSMHRLIMGLTPNDKNLYVDHINRNKLDNRKENLRIVTHAQNLYNRKAFSNSTSGYKGVHKHTYISKKTGKKITKYKVVIHKEFDTAEEAALAYNKVAKELFGEYAYLNDVPN